MKTFIEALPREVAQQLRYLAVDERVYNPVVDELPPFDKLANLKGLTIVQHEDSCRRDWNDEMSTTMLKPRAKMKGAFSGEKIRVKEEATLEFTNIVLPAVEEAMWDWIEQVDKEKRTWVFPKLKLVRLLVGGTRCCEVGSDDEQWLEEEEDDDEDDGYRSGDVHETYEDHDHHIEVVQL